MLLLLLLWLLLLLLLLLRSWLLLRISRKGLMRDRLPWIALTDECWKLVLCLHVLLLAQVHEVEGDSLGMLVGVQNFSIWQHACLRGGL